MKTNRQRMSAVVLAVVLILTLLLSILGITTLFTKKTGSTRADVTGSLKNEKTKEDIKVSVIVPVYNTEKYLDECINSIRNQTLKEIEIICIDDGSPDKCGEILDNYAKEDKRIRVIHQKNAGASEARNKGIEVATGEYLKFVDSDDTIEKDACKISYNRAKEQDADILLYNQPVNEVQKKPVFILFSLSVWSGIYRKEFIDKENLRFKTDLKYAEDQTFNMMCFPKANKIVLIKDNFYNYRSNPTSVRNTSKVEIHSASHAKAVQYIYENWKENGYFEENNVKIIFLRWALSNKNWDTKKVNKMFIKAIGPELLSDDVLNLLDKDTKRKYKKAINDAR